MISTIDNGTAGHSWSQSWLQLVPVFGEPELLADGVESCGHLGQVAGGALAHTGTQTSVSHLQKYLEVSKKYLLFIVAKLLK